MSVILAVAILLPTIHDVDTKDQLRIETIQQIQDHWAYVHHIHEVRRHRRQAARRAIVSTTYTPPVSYGACPTTWADEMLAVGFPPEAIPAMDCIIQRESGGDPNAVNRTSGACGLTQLWPCYGGAAWLDPITNLRQALVKFQASGFGPWS